MRRAIVAAIAITTAIAAMPVRAEDKAASAEVTELQIRAMLAETLAHDLQRRGLHDQAKMACQLYTGTLRSATIEDVVQHDPAGTDRERHRQTVARAWDTGGFYEARMGKCMRGA